MTRELEDLEHLLDLANKVLFAGQPSQTKCEDLVAVCRIRNKVDALDASILTAFEATQEHAAQGHSSPIGWAKHNCRARGKDLSRRRRLARDLRGLPITNQALVDGEITFEHVEVLARAHRLLGEEIFSVLEQPLVDIACREPFVDFAQAVEYAVVRTMPADAEDRARRQDEDQYASSSPTLDGTGKIDAGLAGAGFLVWQAELDRLCRQLLEEDRAEARDRLGRRPLHTELRRENRQRRAAAMVLMAQRSSLYDGPDLGPCPFTLIVHSDDSTVAKILDALRQRVADDATGQDVDLDDYLNDIELDGHSLHETDDGTVVTPHLILLAMLLGTVRGILYDPDGEILRFGRERRLFSKAQAAAIRSKYRRCCHPYGCDRPPARTQIDHVHEHQHGGLTDTDNGGLECDGHNLWKTNNQDKPLPWSARPPDDNQRRRPPDTGPPPPTE
jgi:hypothetical protein